MTAAQMATYQMLHAVKEHGDADPAFWSGSVPFSNAFTLFKTRLAVLDGYVPQQVSPVLSKTQKKTAKDNLKAGLNALVTGLRSYGYDSSRPEVTAMAQYTPSDIGHMTVTDLASIAANLHGETDNILNGSPAVSLTDYGITAQSQAALSASIDSFNTVRAQEKQARSVPVDATAKIAELLPEVSAIADNRLDNAAELLRTAQPDFVSQYFIVRRIDDAGHHALALTVHVQDGAGKPVARALVTLSNGITRKTSAKGNCQVQHLPEGAHIVTVTKAGYVPDAKTVHITGGETEGVVVELVAG